MTIPEGRYAFRIPRSVARGLFSGEKADAGPAHPCCVTYLPPGRKTMPAEIRALFWWVLVPNFVST